MYATSWMDKKIKFISNCPVAIPYNLLTPGYLTANTHVKGVKRKDTYRICIIIYAKTSYHLNETGILKNKGVSWSGKFLRENRRSKLR